MMVAGTLSPFHRMSVTMMPAGSHKRHMGETVRGHSAVCAMVTPFTAWKHMHFTVEQVGRSTKSPQYKHRACTAYSTPSEAGCFFAKPFYIPVALLSTCRTKLCTYVTSVNLSTLATYGCHPSVQS